MAVDLVVNRESYEEIYPSDSDDSDSDDDDLSDSEPENEAMEIFSKESERIKNQIKQAHEGLASASSRLDILDRHGQSFAKSCPDNLNANLDAYKVERKKIFQDYAASDEMLKSMEFEQFKLVKKNRHVRKEAEKNRKEAEKAKLRKATKRQLARQEKVQAKRRLKEERVYFWPKKVYRVVLSLDTNFDITPSLSRRESIDSLGKRALPSSPKADSISIAKRSSTAQDSCQIGLAISYITRYAWWSPRYDLALTTTTGSGMITYRAEFCNKTSESWRDAKVILSTSQTAFQDLGEAIPNMEPWHICLAQGFGVSGMNEALLSRSEMQRDRKGEANKSDKFQVPRNVLFGLVNGNSLFKHDDTWQATAKQKRNPFMGFGSGAQQGARDSSSIFGAPSVQPSGGSSLFGGPSVQPSGGSGLFGGRSVQPSGFADVRFGSSTVSGAKPNPSESDESSDEADAETIIPQDPTIEFEESNWEETGLTATFDVPGVRTIPPSRTTRRHKIASIALKDVRLSYVLVPKLREAAFLKARLRNNSSITLLKGPVGLTLDGSFLGNTTIPRCSAGDAFSLNLGVDPGITVTYQKPVVRRNQVGVFQKEGSCIFTRSLVVTNTKANSVLEGVVLDQVPVSEDEKLKVEVLQPRGLKKEGDHAMSGKAVTVGAVKNGSPSRSVSSADGARGVKVTEDDCGQAVATLKKGGEIRWSLKLNPGQRIRLDLEYETRFPSSERVIGK